MSNCPWCEAFECQEYAADGSCIHSDHMSSVEQAQPESLCRTHLAEYFGMPECELDRMESELDSEYADQTGYSLV